LMWMYVALLIAIVVGYTVIQRQRERALERRIKQAGHNKDLILSELDQAVADEKQREEFWSRKNPLDV